VTIHAPHLREIIIRPAIRHLGLWSEAAENLLMGTAAQESLLGRYLIQMGAGPALGIFQMEPSTHDDCWENYLVYRGDLAASVLKITVGRFPRREQLVWNLYYSTAMCRVQYHRFEKTDPLPAPNDIAGLAALWKKRWNTDLGKGTTDQFIRNYTAMVDWR